MQDEIICYCSKVTKRQILEAIKNGAVTFKDIQKSTNACTVGNCKEMSPKKICCSRDILDILKKAESNFQIQPIEK